MQGLIILFKALARIIASTWRFIPRGFSAIFVIFTFAFDWMNLGFQPAITKLAQTLFGAEYVIHQNVTLAINHDPSYNFLSFLAIINAVLIIFFFCYFLGKFFIGVTGSQAQWMAYIVSILIVGIIELGVLRLTTGEFFFPIKDGIIYLLFNLAPVFTNITWPWTQYLPGHTSINLTSITNSTNQSLTNSSALTNLTSSLVD